MRAAVKRDHHARTITLEVIGVPDLDVTRSWHRKPRFLRPDIVTIGISDGEVQSVNVSGGLVLKSGRASTELRENEKWYGRDLAGDMDRIPAWVRTLVNEAPRGVTTWYYPDSENPAEVLPL